MFPSPVRAIATQGKPPDLRFWGSCIDSPFVGRADSTDARLEVALLGQAERAAGGAFVVDSGGLVVAERVEQVGADGVDPVVPRQRRVVRRVQGVLIHGDGRVWWPSSLRSGSTGAAH